MSSPILVIVGPTGTGKSDAAVQAAAMLNGEVISADSMQVYRGMDIGTAKLSLEERRGIAHHMLDIAAPDEEFTAADYQRQALRCIREVQSAGRVPIVCGGSGLHVNSITYDLRFGQQAGPSPKLREKLDGLTAHQLYTMLQELDQEAADRIHPNNTVRVRRAIELAVQSGPSCARYDFRRFRDDEDFVIVGISPDRMLLRDRLDRRVDRMVAAGLADEVHALNEQYSASRVLAQAIGYKELKSAFSPKEIADAAEQIKLHTKQFAKRQMTWFRRDQRITWFEEGKGAMMEHIEREMHARQS